VAGVSPASVSRALRDPESVSDRTRELVRGALVQIEAADREDAGRAAATVGCLFADATSGPRFSGFDATIWGGIARAAMAHGSDVLLLNIDRRASGESVGEMVRRRGIGALAVRLNEGAQALLDEIAEAGVPALVVAHRHDHPSIGYVCVESRATSRDAVSHLVHLGHRRIGFCMNTVADQDHADRLEGYREALRAHGLEPDAALEMIAPANAEGGVTVVDRLRALPEPPTALFCADPLPTIGALRRLRELGVSVPREFSVVGVDDDKDRMLGSPVYSAVCQDAPGLGQTAGQLLCRMIRFPSTDPPRLELGSSFEINQTTGPAPRRVGAGHAG
jgi:DNA-binding LacI/PurR family transcriptional regulator